jgi:hypothetical protein
MVCKNICICLKRNLNTLEEARKLFGPHKDAILDFDW